MKQKNYTTKNEEKNIIKLDYATSGFVKEYNTVRAARAGDLFFALQPIILKSDMPTSSFGLGGTEVFLPEKNDKMPKCVSVEIDRETHLNYKKNKLNSYFQTTHTLCPLLTSLLNHVKIRKLLKEKVFSFGGAVRK